MTIDIFSQTFQECQRTKKFVVCDVLFRVAAFCWVNSPNCAGNFIESDRKKNYCWQKMNSVMSLNHKIEVFCTYQSQFG